jgi:hypothetical protein
MVVFLLSTDKFRLKIFLALFSKHINTRPFKSIFIVMNCPLFLKCFNLISGLSTQCFEFLITYRFCISRLVIFLFLVFLTSFLGGKGKKKSGLATSREGAWGERRYSFYSFITLALKGGESSASLSGRVLSQKKDPRYPLYRRLDGHQIRCGRTELICDLE